MSEQSPCIKIVKNGPYLVSSGVPLDEKIIESEGNDYEMRQGRRFDVPESYALCRCGRSKNMPFCDGSHLHAHFDGEETADRSPYLDRAELYEGPDLSLADDLGLCAFARFCHTVKGSAWELIDRCDDPEIREYALKAVCECPSGRLVAYENGRAVEPEYPPSITILQDPQRGVSGPVWVKGGIPIESADGETYEIRNRVTLCRCGRSRNKPFCDAMHVSVGFADK